MDLQKSYNALDRERHIYILARYGVVPRILRPLWTYCGRIHMVAKSGGCYDTPFKLYRGVTQGDPMYPTISNVFMNAVIRH